MGRAAVVFAVAVLGACVAPAEELGLGAETPGTGPDARVGSDAAARDAGGGRPDAEILDLSVGDAGGGPTPLPAADDVRVCAGKEGAVVDLLVFGRGRIERVSVRLTPSGGGLDVRAAGTARLEVPPDARFGGFARPCPAGLAEPALWIVREPIPSGSDFLFFPRSDTIVLRCDDAPDLFPRDRAHRIDGRLTVLAERCDRRCSGAFELYGGGLRSRCLVTPANLPATPRLHPDRGFAALGLGPSPSGAVERALVYDAPSGTVVGGLSGPELWFQWLPDAWAALVTVGEEGRHSRVLVSPDLDREERPLPALARWRSFRAVHRADGRHLFLLGEPRDPAGDFEWILVEEESLQPVGTLPFSQWPPFVVGGRVVEPWVDEDPDGERTTLFLLRELRPAGP